jgi:hypothetical protein
VPFAFWSGDVGRRGAQHASPVPREGGGGSRGRAQPCVVVRGQCAERGLEVGARAIKIALKAQHARESVLREATPRDGLEVAAFR